MKITNNTTTGTATAAVETKSINLTHGGPMAEAGGVIFDTLEKFEEQYCLFNLAENYRYLHTKKNLNLRLNNCQYNRYYNELTDMLPETVIVSHRNAEHDITTPTYELLAYCDKTDIVYYSILNGGDSTDGLLLAGPFEAVRDVITEPIDCTEYGEFEFSSVRLQYTD